jgi:uncharacterized protein (DUF2141 family)
MKIKIYIILLLVLNACAIQKPPSGGPPDTVPPEILSTEPHNMVTNFDGDYVRFEFSKYMSKSQVIENLFISPDIKVNYDWSGKKLDIEFLEELKPQTTYSISLGTDYSDLHGNKPEISYSIIFSTGNIIDSGKIAGKLFDNNADGTFIFAYYLADIKPDTLDPKHTKPTYRTQIGSNGLFVLEALKPGKYRIFAVKDVMKDGQYDHGIDGFASANNDAVVNDTLQPKILLKSSKAIDDTGPMLYSVEALTQSTVLAEFNESLDSSTVSHNTFIIRDNLHTKQIPAKTAFLNNGTNNQVVIITGRILDTIPQWNLEVVSEGNYALRDSSGNIIQDTVASAFFYAVPEQDTNDLKLIMTIPADSSDNNPTNNSIDFIFNNSIIEKKNILKTHLIKTNDNSEIKYITTFPQENILRIEPSDNLKSVSEYKIEIENFFEDSDSTLQLVFKTADERNYGGLAGIVVDSSDYSGNYLITLYSEENDKVFNCISTDKKWKFKHLIPGNYQIEISSDTNNNGKYDYGYPFPWQPSEKFYRLPGTLHIKARWTVEDFKIIYHGK